MADERYELIEVIQSRFGDLAEQSIEELMEEPVSILRAIAYRDSRDPHR